MKVKKFTCRTCGAPKVNPYKNPYVICDYCGDMIDVDYAAGLNVWNHSEEHTHQYVKAKQRFEANSAKYLAAKNKEAYWKEQYNYWDYYYQHYPEYIPPSVPKGDKYDRFIKAAADMAVDYSFAPQDNKKSEKYNEAYASLVYYQKDGKNYVNYASFIKMIDAYMEFQEESLRFVYDSPKYSIMHEVLPEEFNLKMKLSQIAQVWIPYLSDEEADRFLTKYHLKLEYVDIDEPQRINRVCEGCKKDLQVPAGAMICICEYCRHQNILRETVHCINCGVENTLPERWNIMINCNSCGTELRVVQPLFG